MRAFGSAPRTASAHIALHPSRSYSAPNPLLHKSGGLRELRLYRRQDQPDQLPAGRIGSGSIGLAGNGRLIDWEIFNRPNKGSVNGFSHFAIRAENDHEVVAARILNSDLLPPYQGRLNGPAFNSYGWGRREYLTGLPHFVSAAFTGEFPIARLDFEDDSFPGRAALHAFNPFIPTNDKDSSIPAAFFDLEVTNTTAEPLTYTFAGVLGNPLPANHLHTVEETPWGTRCICAATASARRNCATAT